MASSYQENFNPNSTNLNYDLGLQNISIIDTETGELINFKDKDLNSKKIGLLITLVDPLIISLTGTIVSLPNWNYSICRICL